MLVRSQVRRLSLVSQHDNSVRPDFHESAGDRNLACVCANVIRQKPLRFQERDHLSVSGQYAQLAVESGHFDSVNVGLKDFAFRGNDAQLNLVSHSAVILA